MFYFDELNGYKILRSDLLDKRAGVDAFFTTRDNQPPFRISDKQAKLSYRNSTLSVGEWYAKRIITPQQTHSDHVEIVDGRNDYPDTDGLILTEKDTAIYLRFADCVLYGGFSNEIAESLKQILKNWIYLFGTASV